MGRRRTRTHDFRWITLGRARCADTVFAFYEPKNVKSPVVDRTDS